MTGVQTCALPISYATAGKGSGAHLCMEQFAVEAKLDMLDVPYKTTTEPVMNVMGNTVDTFCNTITQAIPLAKDNRIVLSGIIDSKRSELLPDVPTFKELGYPNVTVHYWIGVFGPANMDPVLVNKIHNAIQKSMENTTVKAQIWVSGSTPMHLTPKEFDNFVKKQIKDNAQIIKRSNIVME